MVDILMNVTLYWRVEIILTEMKSYFFLMLITNSKIIKVY